MITTARVVQPIVAGLLLVYACSWRQAQAKRRSRNWDDLIAQLHSNQLHLETIPVEGVEDLWKRIGGLRGLLVLSRQVPLLIEVADYASEHGGNLDEELLAGLRSDAFQIKISVLSILGVYSFTLSESRISGRLGNSIDSYREMLKKVSQIVETEAAKLSPALC